MSIMQPTAPSDSPQPATGAKPGLPPIPPMPASSSPEPSPVPTQPSAPTNQTPAVADDNDLIEKEWVAQVKQVLQKNAGNPYEQSRQLTQLKADYMQKRYGKDIKVDG